MRLPQSEIGVPVAEPKDGDFVAYLALIEKRQLAALPARAAHAPPSLSGPQMPQSETTKDWTEHAPLATSRTHPQQQQAGLDAGARKALVGAAFLGLFGLFFAVMGLLGDGPIVALLIGTFLLWRAWVAARKALATISSARRDLAARLVASLRQIRKQ
jgi:hypothetical protein